MKIPIDRVQETFEAWFSSLQTYKQTAGLPARGSIAAALVVLEHLKQDYILDLNAHLAGGRAQLRGVNPPAVKAILKRFGETRPFSGEAGRTNRGGPGEVQKMLEALRTLRIEAESPGERNEVLTEFQRLLIEKVREYHNRKHIEITYDSSVTTWTAIHEILRQAERVGKAGPVAQYLVGAKLQLRFPNISISNDRYSAADAQTGRYGDFEVEDTTFHVTVSPMEAVYEKCKRNITANRRVYLLVPDDYIVGVRQLAQVAAPSRIAVESLESFIANNVEELAGFSKDRLVSGFKRLLETYNRRVDAIELDKSLLIDIPPSLL